MIGRRGTALRFAFVVCLCLLIGQSALAAKRKGSKKSHEPTLVDYVAPYAPTIGLSGGLGVLVAMIMTSKASPVALGLVAVLVGSLQSFGMITVHWDRLNKSTMAIIDIDRDGQLTSDDLRDFLFSGGTALIVRGGLVPAFGFIAGFYLGLKLK
mmetsp:Transcript_22405/g.49200  ORF Transcript_22405/g.49200 Transcript_22405/m.49200 type:complete len:154 (+) Transcript_22405:148-609(+)